MTLALSIFDVFTYLIPGSLHLALLTYVSIRFGWIDADFAKDINTTLFIFGVALACYLLGHITFGLGLGKLTDRMMPGLNRTIGLARQFFIDRVPAASGRAFVEADPYTLLAAIEVNSRDAAIEIIRLRALGLMLRKSVPALGLASVVAVVELFVSNDRLLAALCAALLVLATIGALRHGRDFTFWANSKTLEVAFWIPGVDDAFEVSADPGSEKGS